MCVHTEHRECTSDTWLQCIRVNPRIWQRKGFFCLTVVPRNPQNGSPPIVPVDITSRHGNTSEAAEEKHQLSSLCLPWDHHELMLRCNVCTQEISLVKKSALHTHHLLKQGPFVIQPDASELLYILLHYCDCLPCLHYNSHNVVFNCSLYALLQDAKLLCCYFLLRTHSISVTSHTANTLTHPLPTHYNYNSN